MKLPSLLLINIVRLPGNHLEKFIRTAIDIPQILSLSNYLIADKKDQICTYILTGGINYEENMQIVDIMLHIFPTKQHCNYLHQRSNYVPCWFRKSFKKQKFHYRKTHTYAAFVRTALKCLVGKAKTKAWYQC